NRLMDMSTPPASERHRRAPSRQNRSISRPYSYIAATQRDVGSQAVRMEGMSKKKMALGLGIAFIVGLIAFRLYLPTLVKNKANETLNKIPGYQGHIDAVHLHLWRGAYSIDGVQLLKLN